MADEIIEKKPSSPVTTSLLGISAACLIGAMALQGMRLKEYSVAGAKSVTESAKTWKANALTQHYATVDALKRTSFENTGLPPEEKVTEEKK